MRILLIGDIVGKPGRQILGRSLAGLRKRHRLDVVIANAENAAGGSGLTPAMYHELIRYGVDGVTLGDHIYKKKEIYSILEQATNIVKPANYPPRAPGRTWMQLHDGQGVPLAVVSLLGRVFMRPVDCPLLAIDRVLEEIPDEIAVRIVDVHAEATSDKQLIARYLDGRVSAVVGTHTHVPTADACVLPGGTAFQCDLGMTGPYESILGRRIDRVLETTHSFRPTPFDVAERDVRLCGAIVEVDVASGRACSIDRLEVRESELPELEALAAQPESTTA